MTEYPKKVLVSEEGPREGFQIEKEFIPTDRKIALIDALSKTGLRQIQVGSFVSPKRVQGLADVEQVLSGMTPVEGVEYDAIWFNAAGLARAMSAPHLTLAGKIRAYPSKAFLRRNLNRTPEEHLAYTHDEMRRYRDFGIPCRRGRLPRLSAATSKATLPSPKFCMRWTGFTKLPQNMARPSRSSPSPTRWRGERLTPSSAS
jgi:hydroxymethylglutaryl-CoA lyase